MTVTKVAQDIWKISLSSNVYFLDFDTKILIDAGDRKDRAELKMFASKLIELDKVQKIFFTHLHYDHIGNFDLFPSAAMYASEEAIECLKKNALGTILNQDMVQKFKDAEVSTTRDAHGLKVIKTPGHTQGSICLWYEKERILFSGDTMFKNGLGRTDLPTSVPDNMQNNVMQLLKLNHKILCPGHDY